MLFNSLQFLVFFPVVTSAYFLLPSRGRWMLLLAASCYFYMAFVPAYILILFAVILVDYVAGLMIEGAAGTTRKAWLLASLASNVGMLAVFKYFNFFERSAATMARAVGWDLPPAEMALALPIGLSFHTFQAMSYTIEVYRGRHPAERHPGIFALYVLFYPQMVAGPIERPQNLLHQFREPMRFDYGRVTGGLKLMAWGLFKKMVVADRLAVIVGRAYGDPASHAGPPLWLATYAFSYQIFCDFSGYSDVARGAARVMGFRLMENFLSPYAAESVADFWRRWHVSLSSWFRDYVYIPLGGNRVSGARRTLNVACVFLLSGLWHGASWAFVAWGGLHAGYLMGSEWTASWRAWLAARTGLVRVPAVHRWIRRAVVFNLVAFAWVFFRAGSLLTSLDIVRLMRRGWRHPLAGVGPLLAHDWMIPVAGIGLVETVEAMHRRGRLAGVVGGLPAWARLGAYAALAGAIVLLRATRPQDFIYFQF